MAHDLIFFEKRSTPKVVSKGQKFRAPESYGKQTRRRPATEEEEKQIANGQWVRVDQSGTKGGQPGYKKTRMKGKQHLLKHSDIQDGNVLVVVAQEFATPADALAHYGVKGMKWGLRKDERGGDTTVGLTADEKTLLFYGSIVALYGARKGQKYYMDSGIREAKQTNKEVKKGEKFDWKKNENLSGKKTVEEIGRDIVPQINPGFGAKGTQMNCRRCTLTYEMRRRGNDVRATKSQYATGQEFSGIQKALAKEGTKVKRREYENIWGRDEIGDFNTMARLSPADRSARIFNTLDRQPDGSRGELAVSWLFGGGHSMAYEIIGGKATIFDGQTGEIYITPQSFERFAGITTSAYSTRLDDKPLNNEYLKRWMVNNAD